MTLTEFEEKVRKSGDTVEVDAVVMYDLVSDMSLLEQALTSPFLKDGDALLCEIKDEKARDAVDRACNRVSDFTSMYLESMGVKEK